MIQKLKRIFDYGTLLVKYTITKHDKKKYETKNKQLISQIGILNKNLEYEKNRTKTFRSCYRKKLNEYEDLIKTIGKGVTNNGKTKKLQQSK